MVDCWVGKHAAVAFLGDAAWILAWVVVVLCGGLWCGAVTVVVGPAVSGGAGMWPYRSSRNKVCLGWYGGLAVVVFGWCEVPVVASMSRDLASRGGPR